MKKYIFLLSILFALSGCYSEDRLSPTTGISVAGKFDFPQEGTPPEVQAVLDDIYRRYGTKVIYKGLTESDFRRSWTAPQGGNSTTITYTWNELSGADLLEAVTILRDKALGLLPEEITREGLKAYPYIYLIDDLVMSSPAMTDQGPVIRHDVLPSYPVRALDALTVNLQVGASDDSYRYKVYYPLSIAAELFGQVFAKGLLTLPEAFYENQATLTTGEMWSYAYIDEGRYPAENYWARQGRVPGVSDGHIYIGKHTSANFSPRATSVQGADSGPLSGRYYEVPNYFLILCADPHWREHDSVRGTVDMTTTGVFYDCPRLMNRFRQFYDEMKRHGIDFDVIQQRLYDGTSVDTSNRVFTRKVTPPEELEKYIYYDFNDN